MLFSPKGCGDDLPTVQFVLTGRSRSNETQLEIAAPVEALWKALADPAELVRWFPLEAQVTPGPGGSIRCSATREATVWLSAYGVPRADVAAFEERWNRLLKQVLA